MGTQTNSSEWRFNSISKTFCQYLPKITPTKTQKIQDRACYNFNKKEKKKQNSTVLDIWKDSQEAIHSVRTKS